MDGRRFGEFAAGMWWLLRQLQVRSLYREHAAIAGRLAECSTLAVSSFKPESPALDALQGRIAAMKAALAMPDYPALYRTADRLRSQIESVFCHGRATGGAGEPGGDALCQFLDRARGELHAFDRYAVQLCVEALADRESPQDAAAVACSSVLRRTVLGEALHPPDTAHSILTEKTGAADDSAESISIWRTYAHGVADPEGVAALTVVAEEERTTRLEVLAAEVQKVQQGAEEQNPSPLAVDSCYDAVEYSLALGLVIVSELPDLGQALADEWRARYARRPLDLDDENNQALLEAYGRIAQRFRDENEFFPDPDEEIPVTGECPLCHRRLGDWGEATCEHCVTSLLCDWDDFCPNGTYGGALIDTVAGSVAPLNVAVLALLASDPEATDFPTLTTDRVRKLVEIVATGTEMSEWGVERDYEADTEAFTDYMLDACRKGGIKLHLTQYDTGDPFGTCPLVLWAEDASRAAELVQAAMVEDIDEIYRAIESGSARGGEG